MDGRVAAVLAIGPINREMGARQRGEREGRREEAKLGKGSERELREGERATGGMTARAEGRIVISSENGAAQRRCTSLRFQSGVKPIPMFRAWPGHSVVRLRIAFNLYTRL